MQGEGGKWFEEGSDGNRRPEIWQNVINLPLKSDTRTPFTATTGLSVPSNFSA